MVEPFAADELVRVTLDDWLVRLKWAPGVRITESAATTAMADVNRVCGADRYPMLVDMTETESVTRAARNVFTIPCAANVIALLGKSPVDRVIANFVLGVSKLPTPTRFFNAEPAALSWLREARDGDDG